MYIYIYIYIYICVCVCVCVYTYICKFIYVYICNIYLSINLSIYTYIYMFDWCIGLGDRGSVSGWVIPKTQKMVLDFSLLNTQHYKTRIKGKMEQTRERSCDPPTWHFGVVAIEKGAFWWPSTTVGNFTYIYVRGDKINPTKYMRKKIQTDERYIFGVVDGIFL